VTDTHKQFYRAFEDRFRGSRENIKEKLKVYLPFIQPLHQRYPKGLVIDIGCGRGEFIELMQDEHIIAKGIDLDEGMLEAGLSRGLDMEKGDGVTFLRSMEDESAIAVTAFHVVEHISFDALQNLVNEAKRVLKPGGLLILETPNPENIRVSSETFYLDPTHTKPIPPGLLSFVTEYYGYERNKVIRLQEAEMLASQKYANIAQVLENVSPDYAVIAQKKAEPDIINLLNMPFSHKYGLSPSDLVEKFERRMLRFEELVDKMMKKVAIAEEFAWKAEIQATKAVESLKQTEDSVRQSAESARQSAESAEHAWKHYQIVVNSRSWKLAKPLRILGYMASRSKAVLKSTVKHLLHSSGKMIHRSPLLEKNTRAILDRFPKLKQKIKKAFTAQDPLHNTEGEIKIDPPEPSFPNIQTVSSDLKKAIKKQKEEK